VTMTLLVAGCRNKVATAVVASQLPRKIMTMLMAKDARCFASSKHPPRKNARENERHESSKGPKASSNSSAKLRIQTSNTQQRFKTNRKKDWKNSPSQFTHQVPPVVQSSTYYYHSHRHRLLDDSSTFASPRLILPVMNASALLDPLSYCKASANAAQTHGVSRSISGTDAARRLLRGKKDFLVSARGLKTPALLEGHGVPLQLFQHCIDMADAFLRQYGEDVVECTFHNYYPASKLPQVIRSRSQSGTNRCTPWPPPETVAVDWNHHLTLYLTVMERLACHLGMVFQRKHNSPAPSEDDDDDFTSSPLLFPDSPSSPHWNVDVLRGAYFDLHHSDGSSDSRIPPLPIVEFNHDSETTGHALIRLQGHAMHNHEFSMECSGHPVTLVFDACFRSEV
jgi:hypothetical protein